MIPLEPSTQVVNIHEPTEKTFFREFTRIFTIDIASSHMTVSENGTRTSTEKRGKMVEFADPSTQKEKNPGSQRSSASKIITRVRWLDIALLNRFSVHLRRLADSLFFQGSHP